MNTLTTIPVHKTGLDVDDDHEDSDMTESILFYEKMVVMMGVQRSHSQAKLIKTDFLFYSIFFFFRNANL